jgi:NAD(P)-dependent dehydrogenase (short-subunit alcohol dehydrogenase family)
MNLEHGQVAVVTGAASGIGFGLCEAFGRRGLSVVLADVDRDTLREAEAKLVAVGVPTLSAVVDVSSFSEVQELARRTLHHFHRVDVLCNNAGVSSRHAPLWEYDLKDWQWIQSVNLWGVIHGIKTFVPRMIEQGSGHVLNTASMAGISTIPANGPYNAAKHAVVSITETLAADLATHAPGVGTTVLCPGPTRTRLMFEGSRWRPIELTPEVEAGQWVLYDTAPPLSLDAIESAEAALLGIENNKVHVAPNTGSKARALARIEPLLDDLDR